MNTNLFSILPWIKLMSPYMLFGLYYGLLTTLPMGPSQIFCVRSFLLGGNLSGLISLSGSMLAQLITILSIYYSPIYLFLLKPHVLTIVVIPYTLIFSLVIKDFPNYQVLRPVTSLQDSRIVRLFLISFMFQLFNPILLPNPVLTRLTYLLFFRYSTNKVFLVAAFWGWLIGQVVFNYLSKLLLIRVERDSPILYLLAKRSIYTTFSIVSIIKTVAYLGRAPVSFWTTKFMNESHDKEVEFWEISEYQDILWWFFKPWPISFFDPSRENRGNRFIRNCRFDITNSSSFYKGRTATYFFTKCLTDGKERLSFLTLPSLPIFEKQIYRSMAVSPRSLKTYLLSRNWVSEKLIQTKFFQKDLTDRVKLLDTGSSFSKAIGKRVRLIKGKKNRVKIPCTYDPFANNLRIRIPVPQTFLATEDLALTNWRWKELKTVKRSKILKGTAKKNGLKNWMSKKNIYWKKHGFAYFLTWQTLSKRSIRMFQFMFKKRSIYAFDVQKILDKAKSSKVTWEEIMDLDFENRALFFTYLKEEENCCQSNQISFSKAFLFYRHEKYSTAGKTIRKLHEIEDLTMDLARNVAIYFENDFDGPGGDTDFRYRKLRNVGITSPKGKPRSAKLIKRYARISDFRRKFMKGSMRSRRRKTLLWKALQEKIRSAFFLRSVEIPIIFRLPVKQLTTLSPEAWFVEWKKNVNYRFEEQLLDISSLTKENLTAESSESRLARSAIAARTDIGPIHNGRGYMLFFQSRFRKLIKLPMFIILKSFIRIILRQESEWNKDWTKWKKEIHIYCTFDGEEFSQDDLPPRWLREGIQIKIVYPVRLKPWEENRNRKQRTFQKEDIRFRLNKNQGLKSKKKLKLKKPKFTYLTVLGYQTDMPFGTIQKESSFWKPVRKKLILACRKILPRQIKYTYRFIGSNLEKYLKLKSTLLKIKKFNFLSNYNYKGEVPSNSNLNKDYSMNTFVFKNEIVKSNSNIFKEIDRSIAIGGEIHPAISLSKQIVTKERVDKKVNADNDAIHIKNKRIEEDKLKNEDLLMDQVSIEPILDNTNSNYANFPISEQNQHLDCKKTVVILHVFFFESVEEFIIKLFFTIDRVFIHYFNEFLALVKQLTRVLNRINLRDNSSPKDIFLRFGPSSQARLYVDLWNSGVEKSLDLDLLIFDENSNIGRKITQDSYNNVVFNSRESIDSTITKSVESVKHLVNLFDNRKGVDKIDTKSVSEHIAKSVKEWGFSNKLTNLDENTWNNWLDFFYKYNLPSLAWHEIAPGKWKASLNKFEIERDVANELNRKISQSKIHNYSIYSKRNFLLNRLTNFNRIHRHRNLLQNLTDFVQNGDIHNFSVRRTIIAQRFRCQNRIRTIVELVKRDKIERFIQPQSFDRKLKYRSKLDLMLWLDPKVAKMKNLVQNSIKLRGAENHLFKDAEQYNFGLDISTRFQEVLNEFYEVLLEEREDADFVYRWKWKFEAELDKFKNLIGLLSMLENDQDLVTLCTNNEIDLDLLDLRSIFTSRVDLLDNLSIIWAHRLPIVFDDQNLLYKIINPALKYKSRLKNRVNKRLYNKIYTDSYISKMFHLVTERNCKRSHIYNIDDLLLLRRRREFRFLRCFLISTKSHIWKYSGQPILEVERNQKGKRKYLSHLPGLSETQRIKRFLWASYRLEELACTGRFCLGGTTESRFAALKFRMYPIIPSQNKK
uniref:Protein TIC 214 n=1 Tax=Tryonia myriophylla TaxID=170584 RepID=A0A3G5CR85_9MONI|nr:conserved hypothetical chloroplast protein Ycf1 [Tryonia myriophylla]AYW15370.1 conserved hypothetical chloroplast protein Ycf1 [Tryonia myriophylla]